MYLALDCCDLSGRDLRVGLITCPESPTECGVSGCDREASIMKRPWYTKGSYYSM